ncbi:hypothetical protein KW789_01935, partial [Candidatus Saccharibacteria bacterium]|nr:hypothetical protein [Candidatus Saccharibacteria bacterium]
EGTQQMPEAIGDILEKLSRELPSRTAELDEEPVKLVEASPRNEFELIIDGLHPYSNLSKSEIITRVANWDYSQKLTALKAALQRPAPEVLDHANYQISFVTTWQTLLHLVDIKMVTDVQLHEVLPTKMPEVPEIIEEAILSDIYSQIFKKSIDLYGQIQEEHDSKVLDYATLLGHNLQWQATIKARSLVALDSLKPQQPTIEELLKQIKEVISQAHPIIGGYIGQEADGNEAAKVDKAPRKRQRGKRGKGGSKIR